MIGLRHSIYAIVDLSELNSKSVWEPFLILGVKETVDIEDLSEQLKHHGGPMVLIEMPDGFGLFQYKWEIWLAHAIAHGVPEELAILGRNVLKEQEQHSWNVNLQRECGSVDSGREMLKKALQDPEAMTARWSHLLETDGELEID